MLTKLKNTPSDTRIYQFNLPTLFMLLLDIFTKNLFALIIYINDTFIAMILSTIFTWRIFSALFDFCRVEVYTAQHN